MPIVPQSVELIQRLREAFGLRGALSVSIDEVAVPVIPLFDASGPPFRIIGRGVMGFGRITASAGHFPRIDWGPSDGQSTLVADYAFITATTTSFETQIGLDETPPILLPTMLFTEGLPTPATPGVIAVAPAGAVITDSVASPVGQMGSVRAFTNQTTIFPLGGISIPPGYSLFFGGMTAAADLTVTLLGRLYPPVG